MTMTALLTHYEIHQKLRPLTKELVTYTRRSTLNAKYMARRVAEMKQVESKLIALEALPEDEHTQARMKRYRQKINNLSSNISFYQRHHSSAERKKVETEQQIEQLEAMKGKYISPIASQPSEPIVLSVRLFSGDILTLSVDRSHPVAGFADQFAEQHAYQPSTVLRMVFLIQSEEKDDEETDKVFWSPEERHDGLSIGELLGPTLPILHLIIRPSTNLSADDKGKTIRRILRTLQRDESMSNDALYDLYSNWLLTAKFPSTYNLYQKMLAFVQESDNVFPVLTDINQIERQRFLTDLDAFRAFRDSLHTYRSYMKDRGREMLNEMFRTRGRLVVFKSYQIRFYLTIFTVDELFDLGFSSVNIPKKTKYYRFLPNWGKYVEDCKQNTSM